MSASRTEGLPVEQNKPPVIFLMGPTASGKTDLAAALLDHIPAELISVDSALVYRGMDIGSAKPDADFLARAPHHLLDIRDPSEAYSAADFATEVRPLLAQVTARGRTPVLVGGTMLYFKVLLEGLADLPPSDPVVRQQIVKEAEDKGWPELHRQLAEVDPDTAANLHPNHSQRIQRALEIYRLTGQSASALKRVQASSLTSIQSIVDSYDIVQLALLPVNRAFLHERISRRFSIMLEQGLIDEVKALHKRGDLSLDMPAIRAVGYRQVWEYLEGEVDYGDMVEKAVAASRQLAKRQLTWLRGWHGCQPLYIDDGKGNGIPPKVLLENCLKILQNSPIYNWHGK